MTPRERDILLKIIELYIETGEPVGSRTLQKKYSMSISPATIRNVMADLEDKGFLYQPHTSAGRLPTDEGIKYYINYLLFSTGETDTGITAQLIDYLKSSKKHSFEDIFNAVLKFLTKSTGYVSLGINFAIDALIVKEISMVNVASSKVLIIIACEPDYVIHQIFPINVETSLLSKISRELTAKFKGKPLSSVKKEIIEEMDKIQNEFIELSFTLKSQILKMVNSVNDVKITGTSNVFNVIDDDLKRLQELIKILEEKKTLLETFEKLIDTTNKITVILGTDTEIEALEPFSIVAAKYSVRSKDAGLVGIMGPKRMDYCKIIPVVENVSKALSHILSKSNGNQVL
ncbi:heat-inducible transcriptional repressor HrcA [Desulfurobacterium atlanticum]|uniref:Heat-inducible transcription repressor HrcA n=1 Tax=Desulfurobacterium atlanticum TaxID=240169 RepID=A0A239A4H3_9BACT|nr:heat-inducible transcriptional repressor HrcA [Desulfurobacterium atlanticum]SNR90566.1 heat-inducible transcription repressor HrcA [Desulfurobacterium atlanticum]